MDRSTTSIQIGRTTSLFLGLLSKTQKPKISFNPSNATECCNTLQQNKPKI
jgi:hypothetical protein